MPDITAHFATEIYRAEALPPGDPLLAELDAACRQIAEDDTAGQRWCARNGYPGYTSYASLEDLPWRVPAFKALAKLLLGHARAFATHLEWDVRGHAPALNGLWINVLPPGGMHGSHLHPRSALSGTLYVAVPDGAGALTFEDPRLGLMMHAPPRKRNATRRPFVRVAPQPGTLLVWESFVRHEVPVNNATEDRISISFNVRWDEKRA